MMSKPEIRPPLKMISAWKPGVKGDWDGGKTPNSFAAGVFVDAPCGIRV